MYTGYDGKAFKGSVSGIAKYMELDPEKVTIEITRNDIHIKYTGENH